MFWRMILFMVAVSLGWEMTAFAQTAKGTEAEVKAVKKNDADKKESSEVSGEKNKDPEEAKASEESEKDKIVLKNGYVLIKPYIISQTPAGLNVGHKNGVVFIPFSEMSESRQKQYNYDPVKAEKYLARREQARRQRQIRLAKKQTETQAANEDPLDYLETPFTPAGADDTYGKLQNELSFLLRRRAELERQISQVKSTGVLPAGGHSSDTYISYRGGKVYRNKRQNYARQTTDNVNEKRRLLKELNGNLQRNIRRTNVVRSEMTRYKARSAKR